MAAPGKGGGMAPEARLVARGDRAAGQGRQDGVAVDVQIALPRQQRAGIGGVFRRVAELAPRAPGPAPRLSALRDFPRPSARAPRRPFPARRARCRRSVATMSPAPVARRDFAPGRAGAEARDLARLQRFDRAGRRHHASAAHRGRPPAPPSPANSAAADYAWNRHARCPAAKAGRARQDRRPAPGRWYGLVRQVPHLLRQIARQGDGVAAQLKCCRESAAAG